LLSARGQTLSAILFCGELFHEKVFLFFSGVSAKTGAGVAEGVLI
jgi:hypothetical protein